MTAPWSQRAFEDRLDEWIELEAPDEGLRQRVGGWVLTRLDDPYAGMERVAGFDNLWFGVVPGSGRGDLVVVCSLWIDEQDRVVRCDRIGSINHPV